MKPRLISFAAPVLCVWIILIWFAATALLQAQPATQAPQPDTPEISPSPLEFDESTLGGVAEDSIDFELDAAEDSGLNSELRAFGEALSDQLLEHLPPAPPPNVIRAIVGFVALLVLAYLGGHARVRSLERRLNIAQFAMAGLPFVLLGFLASRPFIGILTPSVLEEIGPLLPLALGWIGFSIGSRFTGKTLSALRPGIGTAVFATTVIPFATILGVCVTLLSGLRVAFVVSDAQGVLRDAILLAVAGTMAARSAPHFFAQFSASKQVSQRMLRLIELEQLAGVLGMLLVSTFFRPEASAVAWQLPGAAWLFVVFGIGTVMGLIIFATLNSLPKATQFTAALLGAVTFTAGLASYLRLSTMAVCCISGMILTNLGGVSASKGRATGSAFASWQHQTRDILLRLERPIYLFLLVLAGTLWRPWEWQGWALMILFVAGRFAAKWLATGLIGRAVIRDLDSAERRTLIGAPMGALSVAIVLSAQDLYSGPTIGWIVTAIIGGTILIEIALQWSARNLVHNPPRVGQDLATSAIPPAGPDSQLGDSMRRQGS